MRRYASTEKAARELGFRASVPVRDGIPRTVEWTRENLPRIDAAIEKHAARMASLPEG